MIDLFNLNNEKSIRTTKFAKWKMNFSDSDAGMQTSIFSTFEMDITCQFKLNFILLNQYKIIFIFIFIIEMKV